jgi:hypothetical protein
LAAIASSANGGRVVVKRDSAKANRIVSVSEGLQPAGRLFSAADIRPGFGYAAIEEKHMNSTLVMTVTGVRSSSTAERLRRSGPDCAVSDGATRLRAAYGRNYDRLAAIKRKYDPENFLSMNNNIGPSVERV